MAGKKGVRIKSAGQTQQERDRISLGRIESFLDALVRDNYQCPTCRQQAEIKDINPLVIQAAKIRYDKLRPALSAVEQTNVNPDDKLDDSAILERFKALIAANPELLQQLIAVQAQANPGVKAA